MSGNKILVVGCSYTKGYGLEDEDKNPRLWCNQMFPGASIDNFSRTGANNHWIFLEATRAIQQENYDIVIVQWSAIPRFNLNIGLETWFTRIRACFSDPDITLHGGETVSKGWLGNLGDQLLRYHNDHWDILDLVKYVNALLAIRKDNIFFVNGILPYDRGYFIKKDIKLPSDLSQYEQKLLDVDNRDDYQIFELYNMIHSQYEKYGGIREDKWLNLYESMHTTRIDLANDHPGLKSQDLFAEKFLRKMNDGNRLNTI